MNEFLSGLAMGLFAMFLVVMIVSWWGNPDEVEEEEDGCV